MSITKKIARNFVLPAIIGLKFEKRLFKKSQKKCCIINFHGVRQTKIGVFNNRHLMLEEFEKTIKYLSQNFLVVPLKEAFEYHRGKAITTTKKIVALTFDDGYLNNFELALPILKKYNVAATFFIVTKGLKSKEFLIWPDLIDLIKSQHKEDITINGFKFPKETYFNEKLQHDVLDYIKTLGDKAEDIALELASKHANLKQNINKRAELIDIIRENNFVNYVSEPLIEFGSHTHTHFCLEYLDKSTAAKEMEESKVIIEKFTGRKILSLAFPDGSYTQETIDLAKELGYINLVAVEYKLNEQNKNASILSRFTISNSTTFQSNILRLAKDFDKYGF